MFINYSYFEWIVFFEHPLPTNIVGITRIEHCIILHLSIFGWFGLVTVVVDVELNIIIISDIVVDGHILSIVSIISSGVASEPIFQQFDQIVRFGVIIRIVVAVYVAVYIAIVIDSVFIIHRLIVMSIS